MARTVPRRSARRKGSKIPPAPLILSVTLFCKGIVRDADNAVLAAKFCLDTLVLYGYLPDDNPRYVKSIVLTTSKGKENKTVILLQPYAEKP